MLFQGSYLYQLWNCEVVLKTNSRLHIRPLQDFLQQKHVLTKYAYSHTPQDMLLHEYIDSQGNEDDDDDKITITDLCNSLDQSLASTTLYSTQDILQQLFTGNDPDMKFFEQKQKPLQQQKQQQQKQQHDIGIGCFNISVTPNTVHELQITSSIVAVDNRAPPICTIELIDPITNWKHKCMTPLTSTRPNVSSRIFIPSNVHFVHVFIWFHPDSLFTRQQCEVHFLCDTCFLRPLLQLQNIEHCISYKQLHAKQTVLPLPQADQPWSLNHYFDGIYVIYDNDPRNVHISCNSILLTSHLHQHHITFTPIYPPNKMTTLSTSSNNAHDIPQHSSSCNKCFFDATNETIPILLEQCRIRHPSSSSSSSSSVTAKNNNNSTTIVQALEYAQLMQEERILILSSDVQFCKDWKQQLQEHVCEFPDNWNVMYLMNSSNNNMNLNGNEHSIPSKFCSIDQMITFEYTNGPFAISLNGTTTIQNLLTFLQSNNNNDICHWIHMQQQHQSSLPIMVWNPPLFVIPNNLASLAQNDALWNNNEYDLPMVTICMLITSDQYHAQTLQQVLQCWRQQTYTRWNLLVIALDLQQEWPTIKQIVDHIMQQSRITYAAYSISSQRLKETSRMIINAIKSTQYIMYAHPQYLVFPQKLQQQVQYARYHPRMTGVSHLSGLKVVSSNNNCIPAQPNHFWSMMIPTVLYIEWYRTTFKQWYKNQSKFSYPADVHPNPIHANIVDRIQTINTNSSHIMTLPEILSFRL